MDNHLNYASPYSWRYGSPEMRELWSEISKRKVWRQIWLAVAQAQAKFGLVTDEQLMDLSEHRTQINMGRALEIEAVVQHDLVAELMTFAEQCPKGRGILHLGLTSMDVVDNAEILRQIQALKLILKQLKSSLALFSELIERYATTPITAFTHLQPAEPSSLGYRFAFTAQDLLEDYLALSRLSVTLKGKGIKGAVGTSAALERLIGRDNLYRFEHELAGELGIEFFSITSQTYPRRQDFILFSSLASIGAAVHKFAFDLRILQSPLIGELSEPFAEKQVGSSAMPYKRNPIRAEKINSLSRWLAQFPRTAWDNAANSLLERTLDDSANRRTTIPEAFLITEELLITLNSIMSGISIDADTIKHNLEMFSPFAALEPILLELARSGVDRQTAHEHLRFLSRQAWNTIASSAPKALGELILSDEFILNFLPKAKLIELLQVKDYLGDAPQRALAFAKHIREQIQPG